MKYTTTILRSSIIFLFSACTQNEISVKKGGYYYNDIYFGIHLSDAYKKGVRDGCSTAKGKYKKSHWYFQNEQEYSNAWFLARNKCRNLLKLDKNGDLIL